MSTARKGSVTASRLRSAREAMTRLLPGADIPQMAAKTGLSHNQVAMVCTDRAGHPTLCQLEAWLKTQGAWP